MEKTTKRTHLPQEITDLPEVRSLPEADFAEGKGPLAAKKKRRVRRLLPSEEDAAESQAQAASSLDKAETEENDDPDARWGHGEDDGRILLAENSNQGQAVSDAGPQFAFPGKPVGTLPQSSFGGYSLPDPLASSQNVAYQSAPSFSSGGGSFAQSPSGFAMPNAGLGEPVFPGTPGPQLADPLSVSQTDTPQGGTSVGVSGGFPQNSMGMAVPESQGGGAVFGGAPITAAPEPGYSVLVPPEAPLQQVAISIPQSLSGYVISGPTGAASLMAPTPGATSLFATASALPNALVVSGAPGSLAGTAVPLALGAAAAARSSGDSENSATSTPPPPGPPTITFKQIALSQDTGQSDADLVTSVTDQTITTLLSGTLATGEKVFGSLDDGTNWTDITDKVFGRILRWAGATLIEGDGTLAFMVSDSLGNNGPVSRADYTLDFTAPEITFSQVALSNDTGKSDTDLVTNVAEQTITATLSTAPLETETVFASLDDGWSWIDVNAYISGTKFSLPGVTLFPGTNNITFKVIDLAGNEGVSATQSYTLDTSVSAPTLVLTSDTGALSSDQLSTDGALTMGGSETGSTVEYSVNGGAFGTYDPSSDGVYTVVARQIDVSGNVATGAALTFTRDTTISAPTLTLNQDTGFSSTDLLTQDERLQVAPLESGVSVLYDVNGTLDETYNVATDGVYTVVAISTDMAGNVATGAPIVFTRDTLISTPTIMGLVSDTGLDASDNLTSLADLTLTGLESGALIEYSVDGGAIWATQIPATDGVYSVLVRQTDPAGNSVVGNELIFTRDTQVKKPTLSLTNDSGHDAADRATQDGSLTMIGGVEADTSLFYIVNGEGFRHYQKPVEDGLYSVIAIATDLAGNQVTSDALIFTRDTVASVPTVSLLSDTGISATDRMTNFTTLKVVGQGNDGVVDYSVNGSDFGTYRPLTDGVYTVLARATDKVGNEGITEYVFTRDTVGPTDALTIHLNADTGSNGTDGITRDGSFRLDNLEDGATVEYTVNGISSQTYNPTTDGVYSVTARQRDVSGNLGEATSEPLVFTRDTKVDPATLVLLTDTGISATDHVSQNGTVVLKNLENGATVAYSINGGGFTSEIPEFDGVFTVVAQMTDRAGNVGTTSPLIFTRDTTIHAVTLALVSDTGISATDQLTNNTSLTLLGQESGATVEYSIDGGANWDTRIPTMVDGIYTVLAREYDKAGNLASSQALTFTRDTVVATSLSMVLTHDTGSSDMDGITQDGALTLSGAAGADNTLTYVVNGVSDIRYIPPSDDGVYTVFSVVSDAAGNKASSAPLTFTRDNYTTGPTLALTSDTGISNTDNLSSKTTLKVSGTETGVFVEFSANGGEDFSDAFSLTEDGVYTVIGRSTDRAGNVATGESLIFTRDTTPPEGVLTLELTNDTGLSQTDRVTRDGALLVTGQESGVTLEYKVNGGAFGSYNPNTDGVYVVMVRQRDAAGNLNIENSPPLTFTRDTKISTPGIALVSDTGSSANDRITQIDTLAFSNLENGATVNYQINGAIYANYADAMGVDGVYSIIAQATDAAGNIANSTSFVFTRDTQIDVPILDLNRDTGTPSDHITTDGTLVLGSLEPGATVRYSVNGSNFSTSYNAKTDGIYSVLAQATDIAGNVATTLPLVFTRDSTVSRLTLSLTNDTGSSNTDRVTQDGGVTLTGVIEPDATVAWIVNGVSRPTYSPPTVDGVYTVLAQVTDIAGGVAVVNTLIFTRDTTIPQPQTWLSNDTGASSSDHITSNKTLAVSLTETASTTEFQINGGAFGSYNPTTDGAYTVVARSTDLAGNVNTSLSLVFTLDTTAPTTAPTLSLEEDSGVYGDDNLTQRGNLSLTGEDPQAEVLYSLDGGLKWSGSYSALSDGVYTVLAKQIDAAGNMGAVTSDALIFTRDTVPAVVDFSLVNDTGSSASDKVTQHGALTITVNERLSAASYLVNDQSFGSYSAPTNDGIYTVIAVTTDLAGNKVSSPAFVFTRDTTAFTPAPSLAIDTGTSSTDRLTQDGALNFNNVETYATLSYSVNGTSFLKYSRPTQDGTYTVIATATDLAGNLSTSLAYVFTRDNATDAPVLALVTDTGSSATDNLTKTTTLTVSGAETGAIVSYLVNGEELSSYAPSGDGAYTLYAKSTDRAGNTATSAALVFTRDTTTPAPVLSLVTDTGNSGADQITRDGALNFDGSEAGASLSYLVNGVSATSYADPALDGTYTVKAISTDLAGNLATSIAFTFTRDATAPTTAPTLKLMSDTGSSATDQITREIGVTASGLEAGARVEYNINGGGFGDYTAPANDGTYTVQARQVDVAGNASTAISTFMFTRDTTITEPILALVSDTGIAGDNLSSQVALSLASLELGAKVQYSLNGNSFGTYSPPTSDGTYTVQASATDVAGNMVTTAALIFTRDTSTAAPVLSLVTDTGNSAADRLTRDGSLNFNGAEAGASLSYLVNGVLTSSYADPAQDGTYTVKAISTDLAGNLATSTAFTFTRDATAPTTTPTLALTTDTGTVGDNITNNAALSVNGQDAGAAIEYDVNGGGFGSYTIPTGDGVYTVLARQIDTAGNIGVFTSAPFTFTRDTLTTPPTLALVSDTGIAGDRLTSDAEVAASGFETGGTVEYSLNGGGTFGSYPQITNDGVYTMLARAKDVSGNLATGDPITFTRDTSTTAPILALVTDTGVAGDFVTTDGSVQITNNSSLESGVTVSFKVNGSLSTSYTAPGNNGTYTVVAMATDFAGNVGTSTALTFTRYIPLDTPLLALISDTGSDTTDRLTSNGSIEVTNATKFTVVEYSVNGGGYGTTYAPPASDGVYTVLVHAQDSVGGYADSDAFVFTRDTTPPAKPLLKLTTDSGSNQNDKITNNGAVSVSNSETGGTLEYSTDGVNFGAYTIPTNDGTYTVTARMTDKAGNSITSDQLVFNRDTTAMAPVLGLVTDTGASASDKLTSDGSLYFNNVEASSSLSYLINGALYPTAYTVPSAEGTYTVQAIATDIAGNLATSAAFTFTRDTTAPTAAPTLSLSTDSGSSATDNITSSEGLSVTGMEASATLIYSLNGGTYSSAYSASSDGVYTVVAQQIDAAGNTGMATSTPLIFTRDTTTTAPTLALVSDSGSSSGDRITTDPNLSVIGFESNASVSYVVNGVPAATYIPPTTDGIYTVKATSTDLAGNTAASFFTFTRDTVADTLTLSLTSDTGTSNSDQISQKGEIKVAGLETLATVSYVVNGTTSTSYTAPTMDGVYTVVAKQTDLAGNVNATGATLVFTRDTVEGKPTLALSSDDGTSSSDNITSISLLTVSGQDADASITYSVNGGSYGTYSLPAALGGVYTVSAVATDKAGNAATSDRLVFTRTLLDGQPVLGLVTDTGVSSTDNLSYNVALATTHTNAGATVTYSLNNGAYGGYTEPTVDGVYSLIAVAVEAGVKTLTSDIFVFTRDTTPPTFAPTLNLLSDTGTYATDGITRSEGLSVTDTEVNATLIYSLNGGTTWGTYGASTDGIYTVVARQIDAAGNTSTVVSTPLTFTRDTTTPAPGMTLSTDTANSQVSGTSTDRISQNGSLTITGVESFASLSYVVNGAAAATTYTAPTLDGIYTVTARATDLAGNTASTVYTFTRDTTTTSPTLNLSSDTGTFSTDKLTKTTDLTLSSLESGATVQYSVDGGATWGTYNPSTDGVYTVQAVATDLAGNMATSGKFTFTRDTTVPSTAPTLTLATDSGAYTTDRISQSEALSVTGAEANAILLYSVNGGTYANSYNASSDGVYTVVGRYIDAAGNTSTVASTPLTFTRDTTTTSPTLNLSSDTGTFSTDKLTKTTDLTLSSLESGATVQYSVDGGATWGTYNPSTDGVYTVQALATDLAGNMATSGKFTFTRDTTAPTPPTLSLVSDTGTFSTDRLSQNGSLTITGVESFASLSYVVNGAAAATTYTAPTLDGIYTVTARITDLAGNTASAVYTFTRDTTTTSPTLNLSSDTGTFSTDKLTKTSDLTLSNLESGATVQYSVDGGATWGTYNPSTDGVYTVQALATDLAGNMATSGKFTFTRDTTAPTFAPVLTLSTDTGTFSTDKLTKTTDLSPGTLESWATVEYSVNGGSYTTTYNPSTDGIYTVTARQIDAAGNTSTVNSAPLIFTRDTTTTTPTLSLLTDSGSSTTDKISQFWGLSLDTLESGATVQYSVNGGSWGTYNLVIDGVYTVMAAATDVAGNMATSAAFVFTRDRTVSSPELSVTWAKGDAPKTDRAFDTQLYDRTSKSGELTVRGTITGAEVSYRVNGGAWGTAYSAPTTDGTYTVLANVVTAGGTVTSEALVFTRDTTTTKPTLSLVNDTGTANDKVSNDVRLSVSGAETNATLQYSVNGSGFGEYGAQALAVGTYTLVARAKDSYGNMATSDALMFTRVALALATPGLELTTDTGSSGTDRITQDSGLTVTGSVTGATFLYSVNGGVWGSYIASTDGVYEVQAKVVDPGGNSATSAMLTFTRDTAVETPTLALTNDTGVGLPDRITSNGALTLNINETVTAQYSLNGGTTWGTYNPSTDGVYTVMVKIQDKVGNIAISDSLVFTRDTTGNTPTLSLMNDTGSSSTDQVTSDVGLKINGLEGGTTVRYIIDGVDNDVLYTPPAGNGTYTIEAVSTDLTGNIATSAAFIFTREVADGQPLLSLTNDSGDPMDRVSNDGSLTVTDAYADATVAFAVNNGAFGDYSEPTTDGIYTVVARAVGTDNATIVGDAFIFTRDTTAPTAAPTLTLYKDTGSSSTDRITQEAEGVVVSGLESGASVEYSIDGGGFWGALSDNPIVDDGVYTVLARQIDAAGNTGAAVGALTFTRDTTVNEPLVSLLNDTSPALSSLTFDGRLTVSDLEAGATFSYVVNRKMGVVSTITAESSAWEPTEDGVYVITAKQTDLAGNSMFGPGMTFTRDTLASKPTLALTYDSGIQGDNKSTDTRLRVSGLDKGDTVSYNLNGVSSGEYKTPSIDGVYTAYVISIDGAGNQATSNTLTFTREEGSLVLALTNDTAGDVPVTYDETLKMHFDLANGHVGVGDVFQVQVYDESLSTPAWRNVANGHSVTAADVSNGTIDVTLISTDYYNADGKTDNQSYGTYIFRAQATDLAGNQYTTNESQVKVDSYTPSVSGVNGVDLSGARLSHSVLVNGKTYMWLDVPNWDGEARSGDELNRENIDKLFGGGTGTTGIDTTATNRSNTTILSGHELKLVTVADLQEIMDSFSGLPSTWLTNSQQTMQRIAAADLVSSNSDPTKSIHNQLWVDSGGFSWRTTEQDKSFSETVIVQVIPA